MGKRDLGQAPRHLRSDRRKLRRTSRPFPITFIRPFRKNVTTRTRFAFDERLIILFCGGITMMTTASSIILQFQTLLQIHESQGTLHSGSLASPPVSLFNREVVIQKTPAIWHLLPNKLALLRRQTPGVLAKGIPRDNSAREPFPWVLPSICGQRPIKTRSSILVSFSRPLPELLLLRRKRTLNRVANLMEHHGLEAIKC